MGLCLQKVTFRNFRSWRSLSLDGLGPLTVLDGANAVGKTNVIEGIQLLCALSSFRHPTSAQAISWGEEQAHLESRLVDEGRLLDVSLDIAESGRTWRLNGKARRAMELRGLLPAVCFTPDDLELAKGSNGVKRTALDDMGSQISRNYHAVRKDYEKMLKQKNRLLKEHASFAYRASVDDVLVAVGAQLSAKRAELAARLRPYVQDYYRALSGLRETIDVSYVPSWEQWDEVSPRDGLFSLEDAREKLSAIITKGTAREEERGRALWGPHADMIAFFIEGRNAASFASQGQQRSLVLAFKLAEVALLKEMTGQQPVLLLDDVMSELDEGRRNALVEFIEGDIQTFITTTNLGYFSGRLLGRARVVELEKEGTVSYLKEASESQRKGLSGPFSLSGTDSTEKE